MKFLFIIFHSVTLVFINNELISTCRMLWLIINPHWNDLTFRWQKLEYTMLPKLTEAEYRGEYKVWLKFADGAEGEVDLTTEFWGEMFKPLKNKDIFAKFSVHKELDTIVWPNGADFAPSFSTRKYDPTIHFSRKQNLT